ncbi:hypothetical protein [Periweissella fabalis]|uniref:Uncharacterized protein n=1 Tax=Periweissella fabalis TaxID=1070421 RepID=A0A7X6N3W7_9LACO|nr:hypothetical protein [Periweissella fabalis]MCM0599129.1 hypothetical protein [Periweissella fabalis]NKZ23408.1 hypothetical protein [Periweissella fabalis]
MICFETDKAAELFHELNNKYLEKFGIDLPSNIQFGLITEFDVQKWMDIVDKSDEEPFRRDTPEEETYLY